MFRSAKTPRLSQNIVRQVREAILAGDLKPGDRLPSEKELAENFGVSKASLREAIRSLEALGLVEVRQGVSGGAFIREVDLETARNSLFNYIYFQNPAIGEFTQLRTMIEPAVAEIAARRADERDLADLRRNLERTREMLDEQPFYYDLDTQFHHRIAEISGNRLVCFVIDSLKNAVVNIKLELELDREFSVQVFDAHTRILDALQRRDPKQARAEMHRHILEVDEQMKAFCDGDALFSP